MKQIPILSGRCLVVELPEGAIEPRITQPFGIYLTVNDRFGFNRIKLPPGNWRIIGMLSEVTEEQAFNIVQSFKFKGGYLYNNYITGNRDTTDTALESLESAILVEGYYLDKNPYADNLRDAVDKTPSRDYASKLEEANIFRQAQTHVLDRSRCLLLGRED